MEHILCPGNDLVKQVFVGGVAYNRNKAERIYDQRNGNEKDTAKTKQSGPLLLWKIHKGIPYKQDAKSKAGINTGPFGCNAKGHVDPAEGKRGVNA